MNGGNVLSNILEPLKDKFEFAQIYCRREKPANNICTKYFQLSEDDMLRSVFNFSSFGKKNELLASKVENFSKTEHSPFVSYSRRHSQIEYFIRNFLWKISKWETTELDNFITEFNPDVIFAPLYPQTYKFMLDIDLYVSKLISKKLVSYISDDNLSYKQFSFSPLFWLSRWLFRKKVIQSKHHYKLMYTMTLEQKEETEALLQIPVKILKKGLDFSGEFRPKIVQTPIRVIYGGNLIYGRHTTLCKIADAIKRINTENGIFFELHVFTSTVLSKRIIHKLDDKFNTFMHGPVSQEILSLEYEKANIALHIESFHYSARLDTRLSFSTKIVDLLYYRCCVVAVCPKEIASYRYLERTSSAICISDLNDLYTRFLEIKEDPSIINKYAAKAWDCGVQNHSLKANSEMIIKDFD